MGKIENSKAGDATHPAGSQEKQGMFSDPVMMCKATYVCRPA
jgi:hypothetical protein